MQRKNSGLNRRRKPTAITEAWIALLRQVMAVTGRGYRRYSLRNTGKGADRRRDKLDGVPRVFARYRNRYETV